MSVIEVSGITKKYGSFTALDNFSTSVSGGVVGLLGHNGAGKSTFLRILTQIYTPTSGVITIDGEELHASHRNLFGYLPEDKGLYQDISLIDQLVYFAQLRGLKPSKAKKKVDYWLERFELSEWRYKKMEALSKGMQQKIQFIASIIHEPPIVVLDEPLSGLDPANAHEINSYILEAKGKGQTVIFSTHRMEQAEGICDSIIMLSHGKKVIDSPVEAVKKDHFDNTYTVVFEKNGGEKILSSVSGVSILESLSETTFNITLEKTTPNTVLASVIAKAEVRSFTENLPSLQEIFLKYV